jgi:hypothetical protein
MCLPSFGHVPPTEAFSVDTCYKVRFTVQFIQFLVSDPSLTVIRPSVPPLITFEPIFIKFSRRRAIEGDLDVVIFNSTASVILK